MALLEAHSLIEACSECGEQQLTFKAVTLQLCLSRDDRDNCGQALRPESSKSAGLLAGCPWEVPDDNL